jgi:hypothetical protein
MSDDDELGPQAMGEAYWDEAEADSATVVDHLQDDAGGWDILSVDLAGDDDDGEVLFLLVIRRRVSNGGNLILSERYYRYDTNEREGTWLQNGIERRVNGSLVTALKVLYSALDNGDLEADDPMLMDSRGDGLQYNADDLVEPVREVREADRRESDDQDQGRDPRLKESTSGSHVTTVTCEECGGEVAKEDAINLGGGVGVDLWTCEGTHVEGDDGAE